MLKHYLKVCFKMTYAHIKVEVFVLLLCPLIFSFMLGTQMGWYIMSIAMCVGYAIMVYSAAYKIADKDGKSYSQHKPYLAKGIVISASTLLITLIITLLYDFSFYHQFADYDIQMKAEFILRNLFKGWNFMAEGFRVDTNGAISPLYWVLIYMLMPMFSFLGYWAGMNRYEFGYKFFSTLVYKKKPENDNK